MPTPLQLVAFDAPVVSVLDVWEDSVTLSIRQPTHTESVAALEAPPGGRTVALPVIPALPRKLEVQATCLEPEVQARSNGVRTIFVEGHQVTSLCLSELVPHAAYDIRVRGVTTFSDVGGSDDTTPGSRVPRLGAWSPLLHIALLPRISVCQGEVRPRELNVKWDFGGWAAPTAATSAECNSAVDVNMHPRAFCHGVTMFEVKICRSVTMSDPAPQVERFVSNLVPGVTSLGGERCIPLDPRICPAQDGGDAVFMVSVRAFRPTHSAASVVGSDGPVGSHLRVAGVYSAWSTPRRFICLRSLVVDLHSIGSDCCTVSWFRERRPASVGSLAASGEGEPSHVPDTVDAAVYAPTLYVWCAAVSSPSAAAVGVATCQMPRDTVFTANVVTLSSGRHSRSSMEGAEGVVDQSRSTGSIALGHVLDADTVYHAEFSYRQETGEPSHVFFRFSTLPAPKLVLSESIRGVTYLCPAFSLCTKFPGRASDLMDQEYVCETYDEAARRATTRPSTHIRSDADVVELSRAGSRDEEIFERPRPSVNRHRPEFRLVCNRTNGYCIESSAAWSDAAAEGSHSSPPSVVEHSHMLPCLFEVQATYRGEVAASALILHAPNAAGPSFVPPTTVEDLETAYRRALLWWESSAACMSKDVIGQLGFDVPCASPHVVLLRALKPDTPYVLRIRSAMMELDSVITAMRSFRSAASHQLLLQGSSEKYHDLCTTLSSVAVWSSWYDVTQDPVATQAPIECRLEHTTPHSMVLSFTSLTHQQNTHTKAASTIKDDNGDDGRLVRQPKTPEVCTLLTWFRPRAMSPDVVAAEASSVVSRHSWTEVLQSGSCAALHSAASSSEDKRMGSSGVAMMLLDLSLHDDQGSSAHSRHDANCPLERRLVRRGLLEEFLPSAYTPLVDMDRTEAVYSMAMMLYSRNTLWSELDPNTAFVVTWNAVDAFGMWHGCRTRDVRTLPLFVPRSLGALLSELSSAVESRDETSVKLPYLDLAHHDLPLTDLLSSCVDGDNDRRGERFTAQALEPNRASQLSGVPVGSRRQMNPRDSMESQRAMSGGAATTLAAFESSRRAKLGKLTIELRSLGTDDASVGWTPISWDAGTPQAHLPNEFRMSILWTPLPHCAVAGSSAATASPWKGDALGSSNQLLLADDTTHGKHLLFRTVGTSVRVRNLSADYRYEVRLAVLDKNYATWSPWSEPVSFTVTEPYALSLQSVTPGGFELSWTKAITSVDPRTRMASHHEKEQQHVVRIVSYEVSVKFASWETCARRAFDAFYAIHRERISPGNSRGTSPNRGAVNRSSDGNDAETTLSPVESRDVKVETSFGVVHMNSSASLASPSRSVTMLGSQQDMVGDPSDFLALVVRDAAFWEVNTEMQLGGLVTQVTTSSSLLPGPGAGSVLQSFRTSSLAYGCYCCEVRAHFQHGSHSPWSNPQFISIYPLRLSRPIASEGGSVSFEWTLARKCPEGSRQDEHGREKDAGAPGKVELLGILREVDEDDATSTTGTVTYFSILPSVTCVTTRRSGRHVLQNLNDNVSQRYRVEAIAVVCGEIPDVLSNTDAKLQRSARSAAQDSPEAKAARRLRASINRSLSGVTSVLQKRLLQAVQQFPLATKFTRRMMQSSVPLSSAGLLTEVQSSLIHCGAAADVPQPLFFSTLPPVEVQVEDVGFDDAIVSFRRISSLLVPRGAAGSAAATYDSSTGPAPSSESEVYSLVLVDPATTDVRIETVTPSKPLLPLRLTKRICGVSSGSSVLVRVFPHRVVVTNGAESAARLREIVTATGQPPGRVATLSVLPPLQVFWMRRSRMVELFGQVSLSTGSRYRSDDAPSEHANDVIVFLSNARRIDIVDSGDRSAACDSKTGRLGSSSSTGIISQSFCCYEVVDASAPVVAGAADMRNTEETSSSSSVPPSQLSVTRLVTLRKDYTGESSPPQVVVFEAVGVPRRATEVALTRTTKLAATFAHAVHEHTDETATSTLSPERIEEQQQQQRSARHVSRFASCGFSPSSNSVVAPPAVTLPYYETQSHFTIEGRQKNLVGEWSAWTRACISFK